tara:strand:- start:4505 stop:4732 length:228 start_codon:yes stop_codon:yes gene_type:complete
LDVGVAYYDRATPVITEGNERAIERATDRASPNVRPTDRDASATRHRSGCDRRDLGRAGARAGGGVAARIASAFS